MDIHRRKIKDMKLIYRVLSLSFGIAMLLLAACAATMPAKKTEIPVEDSRNGGTETDVKQELQKNLQSPRSLPLSSEEPEFFPVSEEVSPLKARIDLSARNTPLRDVLYVIGESTGLNIVMEKGVNPEAPITVTLKGIDAEEALGIVFSSVDYFYSIKKNILIVKATDTKIFEFGHPAVIQSYSVNVGGDMLGAAASEAGVTGSITQTITSDDKAFNLWDSIESALKNLVAASSEAGLNTGFNVNRMTGTVLVTATKKDLERVENYLTRLRNIISRQILVEARIVEVTLSEGLKYGIDWTFLDNWQGVGALNIATNLFRDVVDTASQNFTVGTTGVSFTALLRALQQQGEIKVLSNPRVSIMNGQTALLSVGRQVDFISKVETTKETDTAGVTTYTYSVETDTVLSGIMIGIVPYISEDGEISMTITPIISDLVELTEKTVGVGSGSTTQLSLPTIDLRELSTTVKVRDGEMIVIGGHIQRKEVLDDKGVPFLSSLPLIGALFKSHKKTTESLELVIMLRPVIVK